MAPPPLRTLTLMDIETMSSHDLFDEIKAAIHQSRDEHKDLAEDVVRILKFKRGLLLADPKNATETFADQGLGYQDARDSMDKILSSFSDTTSDACIQIKQAVNEYFDAEPEEKLEKLDNNKPGDSSAAKSTDMKILLEQTQQRINNLAAMTASVSTAIHDAPQNTASPAQPQPAQAGSATMSAYSSYPKLVNQYSSKGQGQYKQYRTPKSVYSHYEPHRLGPKVVANETQTSLQSGQLDVEDSDATLDDPDLRRQRSNEAGGLGLVSTTKPGGKKRPHHAIASSLANSISENSRRSSQKLSATSYGCILPATNSFTVPGLSDPAIPSPETETVPDSDAPDAHDSNSQGYSLVQSLAHAYSLLGFDPPYHLHSNEKIAEHYLQVCEGRPSGHKDLVVFHDALYLIADTRKSLFLLGKKFKSATPLFNTSGDFSSQLDEVRKVETGIRTGSDLLLTPSKLAVPAADDMAYAYRPEAFMPHHQRRNRRQPSGDSFASHNMTSPQSPTNWMYSDPPIIGPFAGGFPYHQNNSAFRIGWGGFGFEQTRPQPFDQPGYAAVEKTQGYCYPTKNTESGFTTGGPTAMEAAEQSDIQSGKKWNDRQRVLKNLVDEQLVTLKKHLGQNTDISASQFADAQETWDRLSDIEIIPQNAFGRALSVAQLGPDRTSKYSMSAPNDAEFAEYLENGLNTFLWNDGHLTDAEFNELLENGVRCAFSEYYGEGQTLHHSDLARLARPYRRHSSRDETVQAGAAVINAAKPPELLESARVMQEATDRLGAIDGHKLASRGEDTIGADGDDDEMDDGEFTPATTDSGSPGSGGGLVF